MMTAEESKDPNHMDTISSSISSSSSSTNNIHNNGKNKYCSEVEINSLLAAQAALSCRKRARILFSADHTPLQSILAIPHCGLTVSEHLLRSSVVARRIRLLYPVLPSDSLGTFTTANTSTTTELPNDPEIEENTNNTNTTNNTISSGAFPSCPYSTSTAQVIAQLKKEKLNSIIQQTTHTSTNNTNVTTVTSDSKNHNHSIVPYPSEKQRQMMISTSSNSTNTAIQTTETNNTNSMALVPGQVIIPSATMEAKSTASHGTLITNININSNSNSNSNSNHHTSTNHTNKNHNLGSGGILVMKSQSQETSIPTPHWHAPWNLSTVLSSHLGWVRCIAFDPTNDMFCTGAADRTIKIFDFAKACVGASDALKLTLTGHISTVRGLAFSARHPYLFSAGEDKMIKCWDLETNQVVRHYHGHLSGIYTLKLHPTLDLIVTGGRDGVARVWDVRTKFEVYCLSGHDNTVGSILTKSTDPQVITGSYDSTIKLWDLAAGKCMSTLTHHHKSVRALAQPTFENTFLSGAADTLKKWQAKDGRFLKNFNHENMKSRAVVNALAINDDGVAFSAADDGSMNFWDYATGYCFQKSMTTPQPGSLDAENGIFCAEFDLSGTRLITGEADKSIKIWKQNEDASEITHPIDTPGWRKHCIAEMKRRY